MPVQYSAEQTLATFTEAHVFRLSFIVDFNGAVQADIGIVYGTRNEAGEFEKLTERTVTFPEALPPDVLTDIRALHDKAVNWAIGAGYLPGGGTRT